MEATFPTLTRLVESAKGAAHQSVLCHGVLSGGGVVIVIVAAGLLALWLKVRTPTTRSAALRRLALTIAAGVGGLSPLLRRTGGNAILSRADWLKDR